MTIGAFVLARLGFGTSPSDTERFARLSGATHPARLNAWLEQQLFPEALNDSACDERIARADLKTLVKGLEDLWHDHNVKNPFPPEAETHWTHRYQPFYDTRQATWIRAVYSVRQLQEVLVDFWHNHFSVYGPHDEVAITFPHYDRDVIRAHVLGNFRELLGAVAKSPAMLVYLNNRSSYAGTPNQNYARELLELHTLGAMHYHGVVDPGQVPRLTDGTAAGYCDVDVTETARVFTGWRFADGWEGEGAPNTGAFRFATDWHDGQDKIVLGRRIRTAATGPVEGERLLDVLASHPSTARFIASKLARRLVADKPPDAVVAAGTTAFLTHKNAPDQLRRVVRAIVQCPEFLTAPRKMRRPFEAAVAMLRATGADFTKISDSFQWYLSQAGQPVFERKTPDGYPDEARHWQHVMSMMYRWKLALGISGNWFESEGLKTDVVTATPTNRATADVIVDYWTERILGGPLTRPEDRQELVTLTAGGRRPPYTVLSEEERWLRIPGLVSLLLMSPDFQWR